MAKHSELLSLIKFEYMDYRAIPLMDYQQKQEKKQFINGLMTAARAVGISYDELNAIVNDTKLNDEQHDDLSVPTYIRNQSHLNRAQ